MSQKEISFEEAVKNTIKGSVGSITKAAEMLDIGRNTLYANLFKVEPDPKFEQSVRDVLKVDIKKIREDMKIGLDTPEKLPTKNEPKRNIVKGHTKEEHLAMALRLSSSVHEGEAVEKWIKANHEITKFAPEVMGMTFQNLNHHLRKEKLSDSFRGLFEMKTGMSIERDILGGAPTDLEEKLRTWNLNDILKEIYEEIEKLKRNNK